MAATDTQLLKLAQRCWLDGAAAQALPHSYISQLKEYTQQYLEELPPQFIPHAGDGYGEAICPEIGCFRTIRLGPRFGVDDGSQEGLGSFANLREHIKSSAHRRSKNERLARQKGAKENTGAIPKIALGDKAVNESSGSSGARALGPRKSLLEALDESNTTAASPATQTPSPRRLSAPVRPAFTVKRDAPVSQDATRIDRKPLIKMEEVDPQAWLKTERQPWRARQDVKPSRADLSDDEELPEIPGIPKRDVKPFIKPSLKQEEEKPFAAAQQNAVAGPSSKPAAPTPIVKAVVPAPPPRQAIAGPSSGPAPAAFDYAAHYAAIYGRPAYTADVPMLPYGGPPRRPQIDAGMFSDVADLVGQGGYDSEDEKPYYGRAEYQYNPAARATQHDAFIRECLEDKDLEGTGSVDIARQELGIPPRSAMRIPGMAEEMRLLPHQLIGVNWLRKQEEGALKGGILADEMGLGKTMQMTCQLLLNPPTKSKSPTLIVAPLALLEQWEAEIEDKCEPGRFSIYIHHGPRRSKKHRAIEKYDIVLTTYGMVASEWNADDALSLKEKRKKGKKVMDDFVDDDETPSKSGKHGPLFKIAFHRIILDEAHTIRNRNSLQSRAVSSLDATYRFCLTGTPICNNLGDAYSLLRFLRVRPYNDWNDFRDHICRDERRYPAQSARRLQVIFKRILLRRKKDSQIDGRPLIQLKPKHVDLVTLQFSVEEREVYDFMEKKAQQTINRYIRAGTVMKNYQNVFEMLLRLRQLCSHPALTCEDWFNEAFELPDEHAARVQRREELDRAVELIGDAFVQKVKSQLIAEASARMKAEKDGDVMPEDIECPICLGSIGLENKASVLPCCHRFCSDCIREVLDAPQREDGGDEGPRLRANERPCPSCRQSFSADKVFELGAFEPTDAELGLSSTPEDALGALDQKEEADSEPDPVSEDEDYKPFSKKQRVVAGSDSEDEKPVIRKDRLSRKVTRKAVIEESDDEDYEVDESEDDFIVEDDIDPETLEPYRIKLKKRKRADAIGKGKSRDDAMDVDAPVRKIALKKANKVWQKKSLLADLPKFSQMKPSIKMLKMLELVNEALDNNDKIVVVSQWTSALTLFAAYLEENAISYVRYQGDMNRDARGQALRRWQKSKKINVCLLSLKCGGVGLNMVQGNRCGLSILLSVYKLTQCSMVSMDLAWSPATELQAFDRIHRMGQNKEVWVNRLVVENTVEQRIMEKQAHKGLLSDESLGEGSGRKLQRLSVRDIAEIFGIGR